MYSRLRLQRATTVVHLLALALAAVAAWGVR
jgi:hypothetical protein